MLRHEFRAGLIGLARGPERLAVLQVLPKKDL